MAKRSAAAQPGATGDNMGRLGAFGLGILVGLVAVFADRRLGAGRRAEGKAGVALRQPARAPTQISAAGWRAVLRRAWGEFNEDRIPAVAAGGAFYCLLALFPALGVFVSLYGLIADIEQARRQIASLAGVLPAGGVTVLSEQLERLAAAPQASLGFTFLLSLILSVWSSNAGMKALIAGLNVAYEEREKRNFIALNLQSLGFTAAMILFAVLSLAAIGAGPGLLARFGWEAMQWVALLRWPVLLFVVVALLSVLYRYAPSREHARWRWITPGGVVAGLAWMIMSVGFSIYVGNFGHYDRTYGSLGAVVGFMTWIWLSLIVVLAGAELNAELEAQTSVDTTTGPPQPAGLRGAAVTDGARTRRTGPSGGGLRSR